MNDIDQHRIAHGLLPIYCERPLSDAERSVLFDAHLPGARRRGDIPVTIDLPHSFLLIAYLEPYCKDGWVLYKDIMRHR